MYSTFQRVAKEYYYGKSGPGWYFPQHFPLCFIECQCPYLCPMQSTIKIDVTLDQGRMPEDISWSASDSTMDATRKAKGMILSFWDGAEKTALRIDLWTKDMMVDEMTDFFYQTLMSMADSYDRATRQPELVKDMKKFAKDFYAKFQAEQLKNNKAS